MKLTKIYNTYIDNSSIIGKQKGDKMNRWFSKHKIIIISCIFVILLVTGIAVRNYTTTKRYDDGEWRTDKEPILNRFPQIGDFNKCYWKADLVNKNNRITIPAPTSYWMKGFVYFNETSIETIKTQYNWYRADKDWKPSFDEPILNTNTPEWYFSEEYNNYILTSNYYGKIYINFENNLLFFEVEE
jgi:hypothetical protein